MIGDIEIRRVLMIVIAMATVAAVLAILWFPWSKSQLLTYKGYRCDTMIEMLKDRNTHEAAMATVVEALQADGRAPTFAAQVLREIRPDNQDTRILEPVLGKLLRKTDPISLSAAIEVCRTMGPKAKELQSHLIAILDQALLVTWDDLRLEEEFDLAQVRSGFGVYGMSRGGCQFFDTSIIISTIAALGSMGSEAQLAEPVLLRIKNGEWLFEESGPLGEFIDEASVHAARALARNPTTPPDPNRGAGASAGR